MSDDETVKTTTTVAKIGIDDQGKNNNAVTVGDEVGTGDVNNWADFLNNIDGDVWLISACCVCAYMLVEWAADSAVYAYGRGTSFSSALLCGRDSNTQQISVQKSNLRIVKWALTSQWVVALASMSVFKTDNNEFLQFWDPLMWADSTLLAMSSHFAVMFLVHHIQLILKRRSIHGESRSGDWMNWIPDTAFSTFTIACMLRLMVSMVSSGNTGMASKEVMLIILQSFVGIYFLRSTVVGYQICRALGLIRYLDTMDREDFFQPHEQIPTTHLRTRSNQTDMRAENHRSNEKKLRTRNVMNDDKKTYRTEMKPYGFEYPI